MKKKEEVCNWRYWVSVYDERGETEKVKVLHIKRGYEE